MFLFSIFRLLVLFDFRTLITQQYSNRDRCNAFVRLDVQRNYKLSYRMVLISFITDLCLKKMLITFEFKINMC